MLAPPLKLVLELLEFFGVAHVCAVPISAVAAKLVATFAVTIKQMD